MKRLFTLFAVIFLAQAGMSQSALPNGNFELWEQSPYGPWFEPGGGFFKTLNILDTIQLPPGITAFPVTDPDSVHSGNKAAGLRTQRIDAMAILIPGVIGTLTIDWANSRAILGEPFTWTTKPERFQGYYMAFPVSGDSIGAIILLSKWNSSAHRRDTIAYTKLIFHGVVDSYTEFDESIGYWNNTVMPDSITILLLSCGGYNASNMFGSVGQVGSKAYFDDVTLTNIAGIDMLLMPDVDVTLAPNPASDHITITLSEKIRNGLFEVYDSQGKKITVFTLNSASESFNVSSLKSGTYYYRVTDGSKSMNTGTFVILK